jgi:hypothetical protein
MEWLGHLFEKYPEMAVYLAIGLGLSHRWAEVSGRSRIRSHSAHHLRNAHHCVLLS